jgi:hypothetical protein
MIDGNKVNDIFLDRNGVNLLGTWEFNATDGTFEVAFHLKNYLMFS